ncbi:MAG TPA: hemerythrin family protein, partial [Anaeromyxobacter sp.]
RQGRASREQVTAALGSLDRHTRAHFAREEDAMRRARFPPYEMHAGEHARVLAEMEGAARAFAETGDVERLWRYVAEAVPAWFVTHIQTMDLVTSRFVRQSGG